MISRFVFEDVVRGLSADIRKVFLRMTTRCLCASQFARNPLVSASAIHRYINVLVDLFMVRRLQPWSTNLGKRLVRAPKLYIRDSGLLHALLDIEDIDALHTIALDFNYGCWTHAKLADNLPQSILKLRLGRAGSSMPYSATRPVEQALREARPWAEEFDFDHRHSSERFWRWEELSPHDMNATEECSVL